MKKFLISLMIFLASTFFISNVSAYYSDDRKIIFDLSSVTKDSFLFGTDDNYYDDLVTVDNYFKDSGLNYSIYVKVSNGVVKFAWVFVPSSELNSYDKFKFSVIYKSSSSLSYYVGISKNDVVYNNSYDLTDDFSAFQSGTALSLTSRNNMNVLLNTISDGTVSVNTLINGSSSFTSDVSYSSEDGNYYGSGDFFTLFSSSSDVTYFDLNESALPIVYKAPNGEEVNIERGDVMPQLIDYFETSSSDGDDGSSDDGDDSKDDDNDSCDSIYEASVRTFSYEYSNVTRDSFKFKGMDTSYYDDLITIDNYLSSSGLHYMIVLSRNNGIFDRFYVFINPKYDEGYYNFKFSEVYSLTYSNSIYFGISKNNTVWKYDYDNTTDFTALGSNTNNFIYDVDGMNEILSKILYDENPFVVSSISGSGSFDSSSYDFDDNCRKYRTGGNYVLFSSSDTVTYFSMNNKSYPILYTAPNGEQINIERGDVMPQLKTYFSKTYDDTDFINGIDGQLYSIQYLTDNTFDDSFKISFKYNVNDPVFSGSPYLYGLVKENGLYHWKSLGSLGTVLPNQSVLDSYTETYENGVYTLTIPKFSLSELTGYEKIIIDFEFLLTYGVSDINIVGDNLISRNISFNTFGYEHIIQPFSTTDFSYINFSTSLETYSGPFYFITYDYKYKLKTYFYDTETFKIIGNAFYGSFGSSSWYGYNYIYKISEANKRYIGTLTNLGLVVTYDIEDKLNNMVGGVDVGLFEHYTFKLVYKQSDELYYSVNSDVKNKNSVFVTGKDKDNNLVIINKDIDVSYVFTNVDVQQDVYSFLDYINDYLSNSSDTIAYVKKVIQAFFDDMPSWLNSFFVIVWIFLHLKVTIVLGGWK